MFVQSRFKLINRNAVHHLRGKRIPRSADASMKILLTWLLGASSLCSIAFSEEVNLPMKTISQSSGRHHALSREPLDDLIAMESNDLPKVSRASVVVVNLNGMSSSSSVPPASKSSSTLVSSSSGSTLGPSKSTNSESDSAKSNNPNHTNPMTSPIPISSFVSSKGFSKSKGAHSSSQSPQLSTASPKTTKLTSSSTKSTTPKPELQHNSTPVGRSTDQDSQISEKVKYSNKTSSSTAKSTEKQMNKPVPVTSQPISEPSTETLTKPTGNTTEPSWKPKGKTKSKLPGSSLEKNKGLPISELSDELVNEEEFTTPTPNSRYSIKFRSEKIVTIDGGEPKKKGFRDEDIIERRYWGTESFIPEEVPDEDTGLIREGKIFLNGSPAAEPSLVLERKIAPPLPYKILERPSESVVVEDRPPKPGTIEDIIHRVRVEEPLRQESQQVSRVVSRRLQPSDSKRRYSKKHEEGYHKGRGNEGSKGYEKNKGYKGNHFGDYGKKEDSGYKDRGGKKYRGKEHKERYYGDNKAGKKGRKGHKFGKKGRRNKGHSNKGYKNISHKEEYHVTKKFYDDADDSDFHKKYDDFDSYFKATKGDSRKGKNFKGNKAHDNHGKKNFHKKGKFFDDHAGHNSKYGKKGHKAAKSEHGHKGHYKKGHKSSEGGPKKGHHHPHHGGHGSHSEKRLVSAPLHRRRHEGDRYYDERDDGKRYHVEESRDRRFDEREKERYYDRRDEPRRRFREEEEEPLYEREESRRRHFDSREEEEEYYRRRPHPREQFREEVEEEDEEEEEEYDEEETRPRFRKEETQERYYETGEVAPQHHRKQVREEFYEDATGEPQYRREETRDRIFEAKKGKVAPRRRDNKQLHYESEANLRKNENRRLLNHPKAFTQFESFAPHIEDTTARDEILNSQHSSDHQRTYEYRPSSTIPKDTIVYENSIPGYVQKTEKPTANPNYPLPSKVIKLLELLPELDVLEQIKDLAASKKQSTSSGPVDATTLIPSQTSNPFEKSGISGEQSLPEAHFAEIKTVVSTPSSLPSTTSTSKETSKTEFSFSKTYSASKSTINPSAKVESDSATKSNVQPKSKTKVPSISPTDEIFKRIKSKLTTKTPTSRKSQANSVVPLPSDPKIHTILKPGQNNVKKTQAYTKKSTLPQVVNCDKTNNNCSTFSNQSSSSYMMEISDSEIKVDIPLTNISFSDFDLDTKNDKGATKAGDDSEYLGLGVFAHDDTDNTVTAKATLTGTPKNHTSQSVVYKTELRMDVFDNSSSAAFGLKQPVTESGVAKSTKKVESTIARPSNRTPVKLGKGVEKLKNSSKKNSSKKKPLNNKKSDRNKRRKNKNRRRNRNNKKPKNKKRRRNRKQKKSKNKKMGKKKKANKKIPVTKKPSAETTPLPAPMYQDPRTRSVIASKVFVRSESKQAPKKQGATEKPNAKKTKKKTQKELRKELKKKARKMKKDQKKRDKKSRREKNDKTVTGKNKKQANKEKQSKKTEKRKDKKRNKQTPKQDKKKIKEEKEKIKKKQRKWERARDKKQKQGNEKKNLTKKDNKQTKKKINKQKENKNTEKQNQKSKQHKNQNKRNPDKLKTKENESKELQKREKLKQKKKERQDKRNKKKEKRDKKKMMKLSKEKRRQIREKLDPTPFLIPSTVKPKAN